jgi:hypothetical protein
MIGETTILGLTALCMAGIFGMTALKMWYALRSSSKLESKVMHFGKKLAKITKVLDEFLDEFSQDPGNFSQNVANPELMQQLSKMQNMTFDQAAEMFGISKKDRENPIMRPVLEKIYEQLSAGQTGQKEGQTAFNDWAH